MAHHGLRTSASGAALEVFAEGQAAYVQPRRFADMLDMWGEQILSLGPADAGQLNAQLQLLLEASAPLMERGREAAWMSEELLERLEAEPRPAAAFSSAGVMLAANARAAARMGGSRGASVAGSPARLKNTRPCHLSCPATPSRILPTSRSPRRRRKRRCAASLRVRNAREADDASAGAALL